jgi:hypothetical protein
MDTIAFVNSGDPVEGVHIVINGHDLVDSVRAVELPFATREGAAMIAGGYSGLSSDVVFLPSRHFLGEPKYEGEGGRVIVLGCGGCGEVCCWPLAVRMKFREHEVMWSDFYQEFRGPGHSSGEWRYDGFGPFIFDRRQYEGALSARAAGQDGSMR